MNTDRVIDGRYEVGDLIGHGGMAEVHSGRDNLTGRAVAIKTLRRDYVQDPLFRSRFRHEAEMMTGLRHPAIVSIFDTGHHEFDERSMGAVRVPFIVMEFVAGWSLR